MLAIRQEMMGSLGEVLGGSKEPLKLLHWLLVHCGEVRPFVASPRPPMLPRQREKFVRVEQYLKADPRGCATFLAEVKVRFERTGASASASRAA